MTKRRDNQTKPGLRMNELVAAAGVPKSTILHYLAEGLLPQPIKTSPNMAYYRPETVERIKLIKALQSHHRLSLAEIKRFLDETGGDPTEAVIGLLTEVIFGRQGEPLLGEAEFLEAAGLTPEQLAALKEAELLLPLSDEGYDQEDLAMGKVLAQGLREGIEIEDLSYYPRLGRRIVDAEMALRRRITGSLPDAVDAAVTIDLIKGARMMRTYVIDRLFQLRIARSSGLKDEDLLG